MPLSPDDATTAWTEMTERAVTLLRTSEMQNGIAPAEGETLELLTSGIALGVAAAAEYYRLNPEMVPTDD